MGQCRLAADVPGTARVSSPRCSGRRLPARLSAIDEPVTRIQAVGDVFASLDDAFAELALP